MNKNAGKKETKSNANAPDTTPHAVTLLKQALVKAKTLAMLKTIATRVDGNSGTKAKIGALRHTTTAMLCKVLSAEDSPAWAGLPGAIIPAAFLRAEKLPDHVDAEKLPESVDNMLRLLLELARMYLHEHGHGYVGEALGGGTPTIRVQVDPMLQSETDVDKGTTRTNMGFAQGSATCGFLVPMTNAAKAAVSVAGVMAEYALMATMAGASGPLRDVPFWVDVMRSTKERAEQERAAAEGDEQSSASPAHDVTFAAGSSDDAIDFFTFAPTPEEQTAAVQAAGKILVAEGSEIIARCLTMAIGHAGALTQALTLLMMAQHITDAAAEGEFSVITMLEVGGDDLLRAIATEGGVQ
jgi:hypothetical protein